ncbi:uncharacterized protein LOC129272294 isoform X2 [Lytechinus pictus]|uniref:uncharacterized protein LOC129272294 isoform X2 n=1 Tax=Lytechinus pictus TaxID=7653 RepID=UPI0030BA1E8C
MGETENPENEGQGGIILHRGYLIQGENQTVEGGLTLVFPKNGKRYAVLQNTGPLQFCLSLYKDEKSFMKKEKKSSKFTELHFTANIKIHSLEMMMGRSRKPQNIFIIVHGGMPRYFKPSNGPYTFSRSNPVEMMEWVKGFQKVANAIARRPTITREERASTDGDDDTQVTSRSNKPRPDQDSGIEITSPSTPRGSALSTDQGDKEEEGRSTEDDAPVNILPEAIEMDIPEEEFEDDNDGGGTDGGDDVADGGTNGGAGGSGDIAAEDGPCRRSRMVLNHDRYEEQFIKSTPSDIPKSSVLKSRQIFEPIKEEQDRPKPEPKPRTLKTVEEIRKNIVTMRLSTWPSRPDTEGKDPAKDPDYQKFVVKTERIPSEPEVVAIELGNFPHLPPKSSGSIAKWKTLDRAKDIEKQLRGKPPIGVGRPSPSRASLQDKKLKRARPMRDSSLHNDDDEEEDDVEEEALTSSNQDPESEPPYDRLSKYRRDKNQNEGSVEGQEGNEGGVEEVNDEDKRSSGESLPDEERKRLYTDGVSMRRRPLPQPNKETDWKNVGNMVYEQSCRSCNISVAKSDITNALVLVKVQEEVMIAGWKKDVSDKLHGKLHVGDVILQANDSIIKDAGPDFINMLINSSAKNEILLVIRRLPYASIKELNKTDEQTSWGLETHKNEIRGVSGPALEGGIAPKTSAVLSSKQCEWVVTELAHQRIPLVKCAQDEVKQRLENLSNENNLVLIIQPRDLVSELREGLKRTKHPSQYDV